MKQKFPCGNKVCIARQFALNIFFVINKTKLNFTFKNDMINYAK